ncbi:WbqC family protein [Neisseriaceae bacterium JH1-16]|nr:WbqC family protein [Neisseriaceae bacterium JH1-16]
MNVVISQPMLFPWVGLLEQISLADVFVNYADVQFSKGSFTNRVQIKDATGSRWLTVPLERFHLGDDIDRVRFKPQASWQDSHLSLLASAYQDAPYRQDMLSLVEQVYATPHRNIGELAQASMLAVCDYLEIPLRNKLADSRDLDIGGSSSERVLAIVMALRGKKYITGHGARRYLAHELFEANGVAVEYMNYTMQPYPQQHGAFTPFVSSLDLIANTGVSGRRFIKPSTVDWREFAHE